MFHITFDVRDKHLVQVLRDLTGRCHNLEVAPVGLATPTTRPVPALARPKGKPRGRAVGSEPRNKCEAFINEMPTEFRVGALLNRCKETGISKSTAYAVLKEAIANGKLQKSDTFGCYERLS